jgi:hypothetical protein
VLDDVNIDLISAVTTVAMLTSTVFLHSPAKLAVPLAAAIYLPLRLWFSLLKARIPITGASSGIGAEPGHIFAEKGTG